MKRNRWFTIRTAEEKCDLYPETRERMDADIDAEVNRGAYVSVEIAYAAAAVETRARTLREFINAGANMGAQMGRREFAQALAVDAGFLEIEILWLQHLRDGQSPMSGWRNVPSPYNNGPAN